MAGNPILEQAKAHFAEQMAQEPRVIEVPEWGDGNGPLLIYVWPMNLREMNLISRSVDDDNLEGLATVLVVRAKNEDRKPLFAKAERAAICRQVDPEVLSRIVSEIQTDAQTADEAGN